MDNEYFGDAIEIEYENDYAVFKLYGKGDCEIKVRLNQDREGIKIFPAKAVKIKPKLHGEKIEKDKDYIEIRFQ